MWFQYLCRALLLKDYYKILDVGPSASFAEIRKAYRKLALKYHPDTTNNDPSARARFVEIKEAYETLSHPVRKAKYLQQRWYNQAIAFRKTAMPLSPENFLKQALELEKYLSVQDQFRINREGLALYILSMLSDDAIATLKKYGEPEILGQAIHIILRCTRPLRPVDCKKITDQLMPLAEGNETTISEIEQVLKQSCNQYRLETMYPLLAVVATIILCILIYLAAR